MASIDVDKVVRIDDIYRFYLSVSGNPYGTIDVGTNEIDESTSNDPSRYGAIIRQFMRRIKRY